MPPTLHHIAYTVSETLAGIDLIDTTWEDVTSADILLIFDGLSAQIGIFQDLAMEDIANGKKFHRFVKEIYLSLSSYLRWIEEVKAPLFEQENLEGEELEKAKNAKRLTDLIGLEWMGWIEMLYDDQPQEPERPILSNEEMEKRKEKKETEVLEDESAKVLEVIIADNLEDKQRISDVIHSFLANKKGKDAAEVMLAVKGLHLIYRLPKPRRLMHKYWEMKGGDSTFSEYYNGKEPLKQVEKEKVTMLMEEIRKALLL